jgi:hypothetical protein
MRKRKTEENRDAALDKLFLEEEKTETVDSKITISRNYFRKLNLSMHGGKQFETLDIGETRTMTVDKKDAETVSKQLYTECQQSVEQDIQEYDKQLEDTPAETKKAKKEELNIDKEELVAIAPLLQKLIDCQTKEDLKKLSEEIKEFSTANSLNESQLGYLRTKYSLKAKAFKNEKK